MKLSPAAARSAVIAGSLCSLLLLAFFVRYQFFLLTGAGDYLAWSDTHYFGGIVRAYLAGAADITNLRRWALAAYPPGYPLLLALLQIASGGSLSVVRLLQAGLDSLTCGVLFYVALRLSQSILVATLSAALYAIAFVFAFGAVTLLADSLSPLLVASVLALMLWARDQRPRRWTVLGIIAGFAALVRPDLILLAGPLALWWLAVDRRLPTARNALVGFLAPLLLWGAYSYASTGTFTVTSQGGSYALWAGLGDMPNPYGYFVDDARAGAVVKSECPSCAQYAFFSPEVGRFLLSKYLQAWHDHPSYVLRVTLHRMAQIPFEFPGSDMVRNGRTPIGWYFEVAGLPVLIASLLALMAFGRLAAAYIVALPLLYAEMSIGLVHYEPRYVKYAALSYILAPAAVAILLPQRARIIAIGAAAILLVAGAGFDLSNLNVAMQRVSLASDVRSGRARKVADLASLNWQKLPAAGELVRSEGGLSYVTDDSTISYQLFAAPHLPAGAVAIRYRVVMQDGAIQIGVLSPDTSHWIGSDNVIGAGDHTGEIDVVLPEGGKLVIANARAEKGRSHFILRALNVFVPTSAK